jgi:hypothetical protein
MSDDPQCVHHEPFPLSTFYSPLTMAHDLFTINDAPLTINRQPMTLYRQYFTPAERALLDAVPLDDLASEINLLRLLLARTLAALRKARPVSLKTHAAVLSAFSSSGIVIARLVCLQLKLHHPLDALRQQIEEGKNLGRLRRGVFDYFSPPIPQSPS